MVFAFTLVLGVSLCGLILLVAIRMYQLASQPSLYPDLGNEPPWYSIDFVELVEYVANVMKKSSLKFFIFLLKQAILLYRFAMHEIRKRVRSKVYEILLTDRNRDDERLTSDESAFIQTVKSYKRKIIRDVEKEQRDTR